MCLTDLCRLLELIAWKKYHGFRIFWCSLSTSGAHYLNYEIYSCVIILQDGCYFSAHTLYVWCIKFAYCIKGTLLQLLIGNRIRILSMEHVKYANSNRICFVSCFNSFGQTIYFVAKVSQYVQVDIFRIYPSNLHSMFSRNVNVPKWSK